MKSAGSIHDNGVIAVLFGVFDGFRRNSDGIALTFFKHVRAGFFADDFKLVYRRGTIDVASGKQWFFALFFEMNGKFSAKRGLTRALKSAHHYDRGRLRTDDEFAVRRPHKFGQLFVYDFYDLLRRAEALQNFLPDCFFAHFRNKVLGDVQVYVRFEKGYSYFPHRLLYFKFGEPAFFGHLGKYVIKFFGQTLEYRHQLSPKIFSISLFIGSFSLLSPSISR